MSTTAEVCWDSLSCVSPELVQECLQFGERASACAASMDILQRDVAIKSRDFFQRDNEITMVREIAILSEFLPDGVEITTEPDGRLSVANTQNFHEGAYEGLLTARSEDGKVRGTRIDFPANGPCCEYAALFDGRPMFDNLRKAFMLHAGVSFPAQQG